MTQRAKGSVLGHPVRHARRARPRSLLEHGLVIATALLGIASCGSPETRAPHPTATVDELMNPASCAGCHSKYYEEWASSMHAYASDDPLFLAMNQRGQREAQIGPFCLNCHAPMAVRTGATTDGLNLADVPRQLKGVTCYFCHAVSDVQGSHDNPLQLAADAVMRGELKDPQKNGFHDSGYSALHDRDRLESAQLCGSCHDIVNGKGVHLERTFQEWQETVDRGHVDAARQWLRHFQRQRRDTGTQGTAERREV